MDLFVLNAYIRSNDQFTLMDGVCMILADTIEQAAEKLGGTLEAPATSGEIFPTGRCRVFIPGETTIDLIVKAFAAHTHDSNAVKNSEHFHRSLITIFRLSALLKLESVFVIT